MAGRRTYIDQVIRATGEEFPYYFYDFNGKFLFKPTSRDELQFSHYSGEDLLDLFRDRIMTAMDFLPPMPPATAASHSVGTGPWT